MTSRSIHSTCGANNRMIINRLLNSTTRVQLSSGFRICQVSYFDHQSCASRSYVQYRIRPLNRRDFQQPRRTLFIQTEETPNPNSIKFLPGITVLPEQYGTGFFCTRGDNDARRSPLARKIFNDIEYINGVFLGRDFITLTKEDDSSWKLIRPMALGVIMDFLAEKKPLITEAPKPSDTAAHEDDDEVVLMIKELIEERIRPSVQDDGGDIFFRGFDADLGIVKLQLAGSCKGCPSSSVTLKQGVESMLMHYIPEVQGIEEIVDGELIDLNKKEVETLEQRLERAGIPYSD